MPLVWVRVIPKVGRHSPFEITLTPALSRITGRGGKRFIRHNRRYARQVFPGRLPWMFLLPRQIIRRMRIALFLLMAVALGTLAFGAERPADNQALRKAFHHLIDRPVVDLAPVLRAMPDYRGLAETHLVFTAEPGQPVPAIILRSRSVKAGTRMPVVIVLHGTGGRKEDNLPLLARLADKGFLAIAMDGRYHGERCKKGRGTDDYYAAIAKAYADGASHPWLYDTVFDVTRLIDYLQTRDDVDPARIGLIGFSKGGMETYLAAAMDPRIAVAVPCIAVQSFAYELDNNLWHGRIGTVRGAFDAAAKSDGITHPDSQFVRHFYDKVIPGIYGRFDCPSVLPMICPRPLLIINGDKDPINPLAGTKIATDAAIAAYTAAGKLDHFKAIVEPHTGHAVNAQSTDEAIDWLSRWLINGG
jgi:predicted esterase